MIYSCQLSQMLQNRIFAPLIALCVVASQTVITYAQTMPCTDGGAAPAAAFQIPVFYASDRLTSGEFPSFKPKGPFPLEFGQAPALIGFTAKIDNPDVEKILQWKPESNFQTVTLPQIYLRGYECPNSTAEHTYVGTAAGQDKSTFFHSLNDQARQCGKVVYLYVHGYAMQFDDAIYTCGVLESIVRAPVLCFTWPSVGSVNMTHADKRGDIKHDPDFLPSCVFNAARGYMLDEEMVSGSGEGFSLFSVAAAGSGT